MLSKITELIPGTDHWPQFVANESRQFEARVSMVQVRDTNTRNPLCLPPRYELQLAPRICQPWGGQSEVLTSF